LACFFFLSLADTGINTAAYSVYALLVIEIIQTCMLSSDGWQWLISAWGHANQLEAYHLAWFDVPVLVGIMSSAVQIFFAWRIWMLSKSWFIPCFITLVRMLSYIAKSVSQLLFSDLPYSKHCCHHVRNPGI
jgi:hypothetical protein